MKTEPRVLARDVIDVFAEHFHLPKAFCRQVINALKVANRIDAARPISPPVTPRAISRIALALTSPSVRHAVDTEQHLGALPLLAGEGQPDVETQLTDLVEESCGWRYGNSDFRDGQILIGEDSVLFIEGASYRGKAPRTGLQRFTVIRNQALAQVARDLMPSERGIA